MPSARSRHKPRPPTGARSPTGSEPKRRGRAPARHRGAHLVARQAGKQRGRTKPQRLRFSSSSTGARQQPNALRADPPARRQPPTGARVPENQQITPVDRRSAQTGPIGADLRPSDESSRAIRWPKSAQIPSETEPDPLDFHASSFSSI